MKGLPSAEELVAIALALRLRAAAGPTVVGPTPSRWLQRARRAGVRANVPAAWRD